MPKTLKDVAKEAGVSISTVSRVIRNTGYVSEATRQRVHEIIAKLNYQPDQVARGLKYGRTFAIGFIMHDISNPFFSHAVKGAQQFISNDERTFFDLILANTNGEPNRELQAIEMMVSKRVEGIILASTASEECIQLVSEVVETHRIPVVSIDNQLSGCELGIVSADNQAGAYDLASHLLQHGHRRIGIISGPPHESHARERLEGCLRAFTESGLDVEEDLLIAVGNWTPEHGYNITNRWMKLPKPPTAIFSSNNFMCMGALSALHERNIRVPQDVALVSFDDVEFGHLLLPRLTTLDYPWQKIGEEAVRLILDSIQSQDATFHSKRVRIPTRLLVRESCGCRTGDES